MTLREAITRLVQERKDHHSLSTDLTGQALVLGIEGLLRIENRRAESNGKLGPLLPSETEH